MAIALAPSKGTAAFTSRGRGTIGTISRGRNRGFTLIEVLVVIAIIATLSAMLIIGLKQASAAAKERETRVILEDLRSMVGELDACTSGQGVRAAELLIYGTPPAPGSYPILAVASPLNVSIDAGSTGDRFTSTAVIKTQQFMQQLWNVPGVRQHLSQLPQKSKMLLNPSVTGDQAPVLLDGYGNPIIYVPTAGLSDVMTSGSVRSALYTGSSTITMTVISPDRHGYFVSAGPDGSFSGNPAIHYKTPPGDDNIYSFQD